MAHGLRIRQAIKREDSTGITFLLLFSKRPSLCSEGHINNRFLWFLLEIHLLYKITYFHLFSIYLKMLHIMLTKLFLYLSLTFNHREMFMSVYCSDFQSLKLLQGIYFIYEYIVHVYQKMESHYGFSFLLEVGLMVFWHV